jgi:CubicO group peptidase (beta-lactamase class C family)
VLVTLVWLAGCGLPGPPASPPPGEPATPRTLEEFQSAASRVLGESGVPGAGIALVRRDGVEWAGGLGVADRGRQLPVTADTHFRVGSISKTFVALALVQLYADDEVDLEDEVADLLPEVTIENPWDQTDPVRVIHLLQHTAGLDDMHFADRYAPDDRPPLALADALMLNPGARRVRWRPGTRTAYSNVGYGIAGLILETVAGEPFEDYIEREIFAPLEMTTSSFRLGPPDEARLAQGYAGPDGPPVGFPRIHLRPAGSLHSSPRELARFVQMLLGWGELGTAFVVDPEYLGNMEQPRTSLAARAGVRYGYGSGIAVRRGLPYRMLGHGGGIEGFLSEYAYSTSRDVGYVILLNSTGDGAREALERLAALAVGYLKRDVEPPVKPELRVAAATLDGYTGYYHDASPRQALTWPLGWLIAGRSIVRDGDQLYEVPVAGRRARLVPVTEATFRREGEIDASLAFASDAEGTMVLAGAGVYAERRPRWRIEAVRLPVLAILPVVLSVLPVFLIWTVRVGRARPAGFWALKLTLAGCVVSVLAPAAALALTPGRAWGVPGAGALVVFAASLVLPALAGLVVLLALLARRRGAGWPLTLYALGVGVAMAGLSAYLGSSGLIGVRTWRY